MDEQTRQALSNRASWIKGATLLLFFLLLLVATPMLIVVSLFGWIGLLVKGLRQPMHQPQGVVFPLQAHALGRRGR